MRRIRVLAVVAIVLALLGLAADRGGQLLVERVAANRIQDALATPERPQVDLGGFPFLPELITRNVDEVTVRIADADGGRVQLERIDARLAGVRQEGGGLRVDAISGRGLVSYAALSEAAAPLEVSYGEDGSVEITASAALLGEELAASAAGRPRIEGNRLIVKPERARTSVGGSDTGSTGLSLVPEVAIRLRDIPPNLDVDLEPTEDGIVFTFDGVDVLLASVDPTS